jgi:hypothetical protein
MISEVSISLLKSEVTITQVKSSVEVIGTTIVKDIARFDIVTTQKTALDSNRMILPSIPAGDLLFGMMYVYDLEDGFRMFNNVSVVEEDGIFYAVLTRDDVIDGLGVVSYLVKS